jgi:hypothetical protein
VVIEIFFRILSVSKQKFSKQSYVSKVSGFEAFCTASGSDNGLIVLTSTTSDFGAQVTSPYDLFHYTYMTRTCIFSYGQTIILLQKSKLASVSRPYPELHFPSAVLYFFFFWSVSFNFLSLDPFLFECGLQILNFYFN